MVGCLVVLGGRLGHQLRDVMFGIACRSALIICFRQPGHSTAAMVNTSDDLERQLSTMVCAGD